MVNDIANCIRLERIRQVRAQETEIARQNSAEFRNIIQQKKNLRKNSILTEKKARANESLHDMFNVWEYSLCNVGTAHRSATSEKLKIERNKIEQERSSLKHSEAARKREKAAKISLAEEQEKKRSEEYRNQRIADFRRDASAQERETAIRLAKRSAEEIARNEAHNKWMEQNFPVAKVTSIRNNSERSTLSIEEYGPTIVHAQVIRHGSITYDSNVIESEVDNAKSDYVRKVRKKTLNELRNNTIAKERGHQAATYIKAKEDTWNLEQDFEALHQIDSRRNKSLGSSGKTIPSHHMTAFHEDFESLFSYDDQKHTVDMNQVSNNQSTHKTNKQLEQSQQLTNHRALCEETSQYKEIERSHSKITSIPLWNISNAKESIPTTTIQHEILMKGDRHMFLLLLHIYIHIYVHNMCISFMCS